MPILDCKPNACSALPERKWTVSSIKREVKKKQFRTGRNFSCFAAHLIELDLF